MLTDGSTGKVRPEQTTTERIFERSYPTEKQSSVMWEKTFGSAGDDGAMAVLKAPGGNTGVFVVAGLFGHSSRGNGCAMAMGLEASGRIVWQTLFGRKHKAVAVSISGTRDHGFLLSGHGIQSQDRARVMMVFRLDKNGGVRWERTLSSSTRSAAVGSFELADGRIMVFGHSNPEGRLRPVLRLITLGPGGDALSLVAGKRISPEKRGPKDKRGSAGSKTLLGFGTAQALLPTRDKGIVLVGRARSENGFLVRLDRHGRMVFRRSMGGSKVHAVTSLDSTADHGYVLGGEVRDDKGIDLEVTRVDRKGRIMWARRFGGSEADGAHAVRVLSDGRIAVCGYTFSKGAGQADGWVLLLDPTGKLIWEKTFGGPENDELEGVAETGRGRLLLVGYTSSRGAGFRDAWALGVRPDNGARPKAD